MSALLDARRSTIRERAAAGVPLDRIEAEVIESAPWLERDARAALWLWAWHCCAGMRAPGAPALDCLLGAA
jgi:hypothetical protein